MKLKDGENKLRILSKPILGWLDWKDKKPMRFHMDAKPEKPVDPKKPVKHFWAMVVWDYEKGQIAILEITQQTIQAAIGTLAKDEAWGAPWKYDLKINRKGQDLDTEYAVVPVPPKPVMSEILEAAQETPVELGRLYTSEDPFDVKGKPTTIEASDMPF